MQTNQLSNKRTCCRLCDSAKLVKVLELAPTPPANAFVFAHELNIQQPIFPLDLHFCEDCYHLQLLEVVNPSYLFSNYVYVSGTSPIFVKHFQNYAADLLSKYAPPDGSLVVDLGSNDGTFLRNFLNEGYAVLGVDPAVDIAKEATVSGINTVCAFMDVGLAQDIVHRHGKARIISANNVFAHIDQLQHFVEAINVLLDPQGVFAFEVSYLGDVIDKVLFDTIYHEHLDYHSVIPLQMFLRKNGLELIEVQRVDSHGGSIRCVAQPMGGKYAMDASVAAMISYEENAGLNRIETFLNFSKKIDMLRVEFMNMIEFYRKAGHRFAGFGAPAKATTLMYHFGIDHTLIDYIVDDNPKKQGMFTPGKHIPVKPSTELYNTKPEQIIILAWNFAPAIIKSHAALLQAGCAFITPLPNVKRTQYVEEAVFAG
jgi:SAM-dependent methyltransferase